MGEGAEAASEHGAHEKRGSENAAGVAGRVAGGNGEELKDDQQKHEFEGHVAVEGVADVGVADAEDLGNEPTCDTDREASGDGLQPCGFFARGGGIDGACRAGVSVKATETSLRRRRGRRRLRTPRD